MAGCSAITPRQNHYYPVRNNIDRTSTLGFSIKPPYGGNWYEKLNDNTLYFVKRLPSKDYSIYTQATELHLSNTRIQQESFLQFVKRRKQLDLSSGRYHNIKTDYRPAIDISDYCVRYWQSYDDYKNDNPKSYRVVRVNSHGLVCLHPQRPENGIDMSYVERYLPNSKLSKSRHFKDQADYFLQSLSFSEQGG